jgi:hypothetical protein
MGFQHASKTQPNRPNDAVRDKPPEVSKCQSTTHSQMNNFS